MSNFKELQLENFILENRLRNKNIYKPKFICNKDTGSIIHSNYVYKRSLISYSITDNVIIQNQPKLDDYKIPILSLKSLNVLIKEDNEILKKWRDEVTQNLDQMKNDKEYQENIKKPNMGKVYKSKYPYSRELENKINSVIGTFDIVTDSDLNRLPNLEGNGCLSKLEGIDFSRSLFQDLNKMKLMKRPEPVDYIDKAIEVFKPAEIPGVSDAKLKKSRDLLLKIFDQITEIEMKSRVNNTKIKALVGQYKVLEQVRKSVNRKIGQMQTRMDGLEKKRHEAQEKITNLEYELGKIQNTKKILKQEINDLKELAKRKKTENEQEYKQLRDRVSGLVRAKNEAEEKNFKLNTQYVEIKRMKNKIEDEKKKIESKLDKQIQEQSKTEQELEKISTKLKDLDVKVANNEIKSELIKSQPQQEELKELKSKVGQIARENEKEIIKRRRGRPKGSKSKKPRKPRKQRVKKMKNIEVYIERKPIKKLKKKKIVKKKNIVKKPKDDDNFMFNFSLRGFM